MSSIFYVKQVIEFLPLTVWRLLGQKFPGMCTAVNDIKKFSDKQAAGCVKLVALHVVSWLHNSEKWNEDCSICTKIGWIWISYLRQEFYKWAMNTLQFCGSKRKGHHLGSYQQRTHFNTIKKCMSSQELCKCRPTILPPTAAASNLPCRLYCGSKKKKPPSW